jgi:NAD(P)-dependent dehydrogenase (short-subunit alcohol dehydrogenase family)
MLGALRKRLLRAVAAERVDLKGRRVIVTGTSAGSLGYETARTLASWGADIVVTRRAGAQDIAQDIAQGIAQDLGGALEGERAGRVRGRDLDLSDAGSVRDFAEWVLRDADSEGRAPRLDVLINNAGIHLDLMSDWREPRLSADGFETQWRTNYLGAFQLTHALLPLLRETASTHGEARVVNVVSQLHTKARNADLFVPHQPYKDYNSWVAYGASKLAMVHMAFELERRFGPEGLHGYALHPGAVSTNVASAGLAGHATLERIRAGLAPLERSFLLTPNEGAQTSVHCATAQGLAGGRYFVSCAPSEASPEANDAAARVRLWNETEAWAARL